MADIKTFGVVGAGQMGRGIAQVAAQAGLSVKVADASTELAQKGIDRIGKSLSRLVEKGKIEAADASATLERISAAALSDFGDREFVVEAAPEKLELKQSIVKTLDEALPPGAILASNTSSISITKIAASTGRADRVIGMHFMNPVPVMKLVEIVRGLATSDETYATTASLAQSFGKTTVVSRDIPGFIVNRILIPMLNEACYALYENLGTPDDIDTGIKLGLNHPMGPLELADLIGLDTCWAIAKVLHDELGEDKYRPCPLLRQHVDAGWLGRKSGRGFYRYDDRGKRIAD